MVETFPFAGRVVGDTAFELGEGPTYDPATDTAWWLDIRGCTLVEYPMHGDTVKLHELPEMASVLAFAEDGTQVLATESGLVRRDTASGALTRYRDIEADNPASRSNDGRVHACGALWIGMMSKTAEPRAGTIYHVLRGAVQPLFTGIGIANAICFSPDGATAYFTDTQINELMRVAIDPATALPVGEPEVLFKLDGEGGLDGAVVDADGCLWIARWGAGKVDVHAPAGDLLRSYAVPARQATCPAFVGPAADRLLVTSAWENLDAEQRAADPMAGRTFVLDVPVKGRFEPRLVL